VQCVDALVSGLPSLLAGRGERRHEGSLAVLGVRGLARGTRCAGPPGGVLQRRTVAMEHALDHLPRVLEQVPTVGDLHRSRRAHSGALGVDLRAVARDDLDPGVLAQPLGEALGRTIVQQRDGSPTLQIDEDGAVGMPLAARPLIDAQHARRRLGRGRHAPHEAEHRGGAGDGPECRQQPRARLAQRQANTGHQVCQPAGPPRVRRSERRKPLGEGPPPTGRRHATEPADLQVQAHGRSLPGQVRESPHVATMHPIAARFAVWAAGVAPCDVREEVDARRRDGERLHDQLAMEHRENREDLREGVGLHGTSVGAPRGQPVARRCAGTQVASRIRASNWRHTK